jgi:hypothetical protein
MVHGAFKKIIITFAAIIISGFAFAPAALAGPPVTNLINVLFNHHAPTEQLFNEVNFLPGDEVTRLIDVTNVYTGPLKVTLTFIDPNTGGNSYVDNDGLGSQMDVILKDHGAYGNIFSGTMKALSKAVPLTLTNALPINVSGTYDFSVIFKPEANNDYQGKSLGFNVFIIAESQDGIIETYGSTDGSTSGGGYVCGNGIKEGSEQCDNPSGNGACPNSCSSQCFLNSCVAGISTPLTGGLTYEENTGGNESPPGRVDGELAIARGPGVNVGNGAASGAGGNGGEVLGKTVEGENANPQNKSGTCGPAYWWWWIGYLVYAFLLLLAFWLTRKRKAWWIYIIPTLLAAAAILWWWFEPCPKHLWYWPIGIVVYGVVLGILFNYQKKNNGQQELPLDNQ